MSKKRNTLNWVQTERAILNHLEKKMEQDKKAVEKLTPRERYELKKKEQARWER